MFQYIVKRLLIALPVLLGVTIISFAIMQAAPGDYTDQFIGPNLSQADIQAMKARLGLNDPKPVQYVKWLGNALTGNLGYSFATSEPVTQRIAQRLGPTLGLSLFALVLAYMVAIPTGVISATRQYSLADYSSSFAALVGISIPNFFLGLVLIYLVSLKLNLLPVSGMRTLGIAPSFWDLIKHMILPGIVLSVQMMGSVTRYCRSAMLDVIRQDYVRTARAKGLSDRLVTYKHALRNALLPVVTLLGLQIPGLFGGAIVTEQIFGWPGMGRLAIEAVNQRDYPVIMALNLLTAVLVVLGGLLTDALYAIVDPRIRYS